MATGVSQQTQKDELNEMVFDSDDWAYDVCLDEPYRQVAFGKVLQE